MNLVNKIPIVFKTLANNLKTLVKVKPKNKANLVKKNSDNNKVYLLYKLVKVLKIKVKVLRIKINNNKRVNKPNNNKFILLLASKSHRK